MEKRLSFAEKIRGIRKARNLTMEAFGEIIGVSKGTVSKWESGEVMPPKTTLSLLEKLFGEEKAALYNTGDTELAEIVRLLKEHPQDKKLVLKLLKGKKDIKEALEGFGIKRLVGET